MRSARAALASVEVRLRAVRLSSLSLVAWMLCIMLSSRIEVLVMSWSVLRRESRPTASILAACADNTMAHDEGHTLAAVNAVHAT